MVLVLAGMTSATATNGHSVILAIRGANSEDSTSLWQWAKAHLLRPHTELTLLHVFPRVSFSPAGTARRASPELQAAVQPPEEPFSMRRFDAPFDADEVHWLPPQVVADCTTAVGGRPAIVRHAHAIEVFGDIGAGDLILAYADYAASVAVEKGRRKADFLVIGGRSKRGLGSRLLGCTSEYVAANAACPVCVVRCAVARLMSAVDTRVEAAAGGARGGAAGRSVLVCVDALDEEAEALVRWSKAHLLESADSVLLVNLSTEYLAAPSGGHRRGGGTGGGTAARLAALEEARKEAADRMKRCATLLADFKPQCRELGPFQDAPGAIVDYVDSCSLPLDFLVVGSSCRRPEPPPRGSGSPGRGRLSGTALQPAAFAAAPRTSSAGAQFIAKYANCPVILVPASFSGLYSV